MQSDFQSLKLVAIKSTHMAPPPHKCNIVKPFSVHFKKSYTSITCVAFVARREIRFASNSTGGGTCS